MLWRCGRLLGWKRRKDFFFCFATKFSSLSCFIKMDCWRWPSRLSGKRQREIYWRVFMTEANSPLTYHERISETSFASPERLCNDSVGHVVVVVEAIGESVIVDGRSEAVERRLRFRNGPVLVRLLLRCGLEWIFKRIHWNSCGETTREQERLSVIMCHF